MCASHLDEKLPLQHEETNLNDNNGLRNLSSKHSIHSVVPHFNTIDDNTRVKHRNKIAVYIEP